MLTGILILAREYEIIFTKCRARSIIAIFEAASVTGFAHCAVGYS